MRTFKTTSVISPDERGVGGTVARARRAAAELTPQAIEQIAQRVAALLHQRSDEQPLRQVSAGLVDASELARHLGVTRTWVYEHSNQLGAIRLGDGAKARLRFDLAVATAAVSNRSGDRPDTGDSSRTARPAGRRRGRSPASSTPLLPINPPRNRGILARLAGARFSGRR